MALPRPAVLSVKQSDTLLDKVGALRTWPWGRRETGAERLRRVAGEAVASGRAAVALPTRRRVGPMRRGLAWMAPSTPAAPESRTTVWSVHSVFSAASVGSVASFGSALSVGSVGSLLSIGSAGSILSIGSAGSILSIGSAGSVLSIGSAGSAGSALDLGSGGRDRPAGTEAGDDGRTGALTRITPASLLVTRVATVAGACAIVAAVAS